MDKKDKGIFILCRTSNPGAGEFQDLIISIPGLPAESRLNREKAGAGELQNLRIKDTSEVSRSDSSDGGGATKPLYQKVAENIANEWNYNGNCGLVVGATYPSELEIVRRIVGHIPILIPGIEAQGADVEKTVKAGVDRHGLNAIINSSRSIIFAGNDENFTQKARQKAEKLQNEINKYRLKE